MRRLTEQEAIERIKRIHGENKFDFSLFEYIDTQTKVQLICNDCTKELGHPYIIEIRPSDLMYKKHGCKRCGYKLVGQKLGKTTEQFIKEAQKIFPEYDYSKVVYKGNKTKVLVICPKHGEFLIRPNDLLNRYGCPKCGIEKRKSRVRDTKTFIERAVKIHGDKYDYSLVRYTYAKTKVPIICKTCRELGREHIFYQTPDKHLRGQGCPRCAGNKPLTVEELNKKLEKIHNGKIVCIDHGIDGTASYGSFKCLTCGYIWAAIISNVIKSKDPRGCPRCAIENTRIGLEKFKEIIYEISNGNITCIDNVYLNNKTPILLQCKNGHTFKKSPNNILRRPSCPICNPPSHGFDPTKPGILYYLRVVDPTDNQIYYKIGVTNRSVEERFTSADLQKITVLKTWEYPIGETAYNYEQQILKTFNEYRYNNDKIILESSGDTELFIKDVLELDPLTHKQTEV